MRFSSGERRGTILLLILVAAIVVAMAVWRGYTNPDLRQLPASKPDPVSTDSGMISEKNCMRISDAVDSVGAPRKAHSHKRKHGSSSKKAAAAGRQRDFLDEPVR